MRERRRRSCAVTGPTDVALIVCAVATLLVTGSSAPVHASHGSPTPSLRRVDPGTGSTLAGSGGSTGAAGTTPSPREGCGHPVPAGVERVVNFAVDPATAEGQRTRTALVHVPAGYQPQSPHPVLLVYHGHGGNSAEVAAGTGFRALADQEGFLAVYPQGPRGPIMWASAGPVDHGIQELPATRALLDTLISSYCVDAARVYPTGISNGGGMANYLACRLADRITAVAPVVGSMYEPKDGGCHPTRRLSILDIRATDDPVVPYAGSHSDPAWRLPSLPAWLSGWAVLDRCPATPAVPIDTMTLQVRRWTGCADSTSILAYRITGGHQRPESLGGAPTAAVIWGFLARYRIAAG